MGVGSSGTDSATRFTSGSLSAVGAAPGMYCHRDFNVSVSGTFVGTVVFERSFDGGTTYIPVAFSDGTTVSFSGPMSSTWSEPESGVMYRVRFSAYTSGSVSWRLSQ